MNWQQRWQMEKSGKQKQLFKINLQLHELSKHCSCIFTGTLVATEPAGSTFIGGQVDATLIGMTLLVIFLVHRQKKKTSFPQSPFSQRLRILWRFDRLNRLNLLLLSCQKFPLVLVSSKDSLDLPLILTEAILVVQWSIQQMFYVCLFWLLVLTVEHKTFSIWIWIISVEQEPIASCVRMFNVFVFSRKGNCWTNRQPGFVAFLLQPKESYRSLQSVLPLRRIGPWKQFSDTQNHLNWFESDRCFSFLTSVRALCVFFAKVFFSNQKSPQNSIVFGFAEYSGC